MLDYEDGDETTTDIAKVRALTDGLRLVDAETFVEEATQAALGALRSHWADVRGVAAALVERRTLDRDALYGLLASST